MSCGFPSLWQVDCSHLLPQPFLVIFCASPLLLYSLFKFSVPSSCLGDCLSALLFFLLSRFLLLPVRPQCLVTFSCWSAHTTVSSQRDSPTQTWCVRRECVPSPRITSAVLPSVAHSPSGTQRHGHVQAEASRFFRLVEYVDDLLQVFSLHPAAGV